MPLSGTHQESSLSLRQKLVATLGMIKIAHTIFAMPFAVIGWVWGIAAVREASIINPELEGLSARALPMLAKQLGFESAPWLWTLLWVVVAMIGARSFAMTFNRIVDRKIDAENPRTQKRELPQGVLSLSFAWSFAVASALLFITASAMLNHQTLILAPIALVIVGGYSLTKRFTSLCHVILGIGLALAPIGGWLAATGRAWELMLGVEAPLFGISVFEPIAGGIFSFADSLQILLQPSVLLLSSGVVLWVAGFDVIYSLQDEKFDRSQGLKSLPVRLKPQGALLLARLLHTGTCVAWLFALSTYGSSLESIATAGSPRGLSDYVALHGLGVMSFLGLGAIAACLLYEHSLVKHDDLSRVDAAFFTMNGVISLIFGTLVVFDVFLID